MIRPPFMCNEVSVLLGLECHQLAQARLAHALPVCELCCELTQRTPTNANGHDTPDSPVEWDLYEQQRTYTEPRSQDYGSEG